MKPWLQTERGQLWHAKAEEVYPHIEPGSVAMVWSDGPYAMGKAAWDMMRLDDLAEWYAPHIEAWGRVCAPSASVYLWGTAEGWARLDPAMRAAGWTFRALVVWDKGVAAMAGKVDTAGLRTWYDTTEVCGFYQREAWAPSTCAGQEIGYAAGADERNWIRPWLREEWQAAGLRSKDCDAALGTNGMAGHYFGASQWALPTWEHYQTMHATAQARGPARERPYLVHSSCWPGDLRATYDHLRATYDHLRATYDHLRAEYEASRPAFNCPLGVGNVWSHGQVSGFERLRLDGEAHPCQKPLLFARRAVLASTRPGEVVLDPFGGTNRIAVACAHMRAEEARRFIGIEPELRWLEAVRGAVALDPSAMLPAGQVGLFGGK